MLEKEELERISKIKNLGLRNTERDYLLEVLLYIISQNMGRKLVFEGGTALYKFYSLNRFSEDLDFTSVSKIDINKLFEKIIQRLKAVGINGRIKELSKYQNQKNIRLGLRGPLFDGNLNNLSIISINISLKEKPIEQSEERTLFSQYVDIPSFSVFIMPLNEMFAEKIRAVMTRDKARDVYDIWFLLNKDAKFDIGFINRKLKLYRKKFKRNEFTEKIEEKRKSWEMDLKELILGGLPKFEIVKNEILKKLKL